MKEKRSITVMIPAYNEETNLAKTVRKYGNIVKTMFDDYEFIIFDDCSSDKTGEIADELAKKNRNIRVVHNKQNMGMGYNYREGIKLSQKDYCTFFNGKGEVLEGSARGILSHIGEADIIISYIGNPEVRPLYRRIMSNAFVILLNMIFGHHLKYYTAPVIYKTKILKKLQTTKDINSFVYYAEILIMMIRKGYSYKEVPVYLEKSKKTSFFRIKNLIEIFFGIARLFFNMMVKKRRWRGKQ